MEQATPFRMLLALLALGALACSGAARADGSTSGTTLQPWQNQAGAMADALGRSSAMTGLGSAGLGGSGLGSGGLGSGSLGSAPGLGSSLNGNALMDQGMGEGLSGAPSWANQAGQLEQQLATGGYIDPLVSGMSLGPPSLSDDSTTSSAQNANPGMRLPAYRYGGNVAGHTNPFPTGGAHIPTPRYGLQLPGQQCTGIYPVRGC